jgi:3-oxoacyl-[acyl-carrier protein] reductase
MKLQELKIIVSGGGSGMGRHFALRLAEAGAQVAIGDVNEAALAETVKLAEGVKGQIHSSFLDVSSEDSSTRFVEWAQRAMGGVNALINNAGILRDGLLIKKDKETGAIRKLTKADWDAVIGVNLTGAALLAREVVAAIASTGTRPGVVINMSSVARHGNRGQSSYSAAKAALVAITRTWALEWASFGVRCVAIAPGMVETPMTRGMNQRARDAMVAAVPVGRIGEPEDLWLAIRFALECDYFISRVVDVDGGLGV